MAHQGNSQGFGTWVVRAGNAYALFERVDDEIAPRTWAGSHHGIVATRNAASKTREAGWKCIFGDRFDGAIAGAQASTGCGQSLVRKASRRESLEKGRRRLSLCNTGGRSTRENWIDHVAFSYPELTSAVKRLETKCSRYRAQTQSRHRRRTEGCAWKIAEDSEVGANAYCVHGSQGSRVEARQMSDLRDEIGAGSIPASTSSIRGYEDVAESGARGPAG